MATQPLPQGPVYSIDVECVATGTGHDDRAVAQISLVNQYEQVIGVAIFGNKLLTL